MLTNNIDNHLQQKSNSKLPKLSINMDSLLEKTEPKIDIFAFKSTDSLHEKLKEVKKKSHLLLKTQLNESASTGTHRRRRVLIINESVQKFNFKDTTRNLPTNENYEFLSEMINGVHFAQTGTNRKGRKIINLVELQRHEIFAPCQGKKFQLQDKVAGRSPRTAQTSHSKFRNLNKPKSDMNMIGGLQQVDSPNTNSNNNDIFSKFRHFTPNAYTDQPIVSQPKGNFLKPYRPTNSSNGNIQQDPKYLSKGSDNKGIFSSKSVHEIKEAKKLEKESMQYLLPPTSPKSPAFTPINYNHTITNENRTFLIRPNSCISSYIVPKNENIQTQYPITLDTAQSDVDCMNTICLNDVPENTSNQEQLMEFQGFNIIIHPLHPLWNPTAYVPLKKEALEKKLGHKVSENNLKWSNIRRKLVYVLNLFRMMKIKVKTIMEKPHIFPKNPHQHLLSAKFLAAAKFGDYEKIKTLLATYGIEILHSFNHLQQTALHRASSAGHLEIVKLLLSYGANVNAMDFVGRTPLYYAITSKRCEVVQYLLNGRCDPWSPSLQLKYKTLCRDDYHITYYLTKARRLWLGMVMSTPSEREHIWILNRGDLIKSININADNNPF